MISDADIYALQEEDIKKKDLLERIGILRSALEKTTSDQEIHWKQSVDALARSVQKIIEENEKFMAIKKTEMDVSIQAANKKSQNDAEALFSRFSRSLDEFIGKIETRFNGLRNDISEKLDKANGSFLLDSKTNFASAKKELEVIVNNSVNQMVAKMSENKRETETRLANMESLIERTAQKEVEKYFDEIIKKVRSMESSIQEFQDSTAKTIQKYQSDTGLKFSSVDAKLTTVLGKFKAILKEL